MNLAVKVFGTPVAQGSMVCKGNRGGGRHLVVDSKEKLLTPWRAEVRRAGEVLMAHHGLEVLDVPLGMAVTFTVQRPSSVSPATRPWPSLKAARTDLGGGDLDKLARAIGDALSGVVYRDDSQVCELSLTKTYPDGPAPDRLHRPGALIRIFTI